MIRFPQFLIARLWTSEYGDPDVAEEFGWLHAYSPYHHVDDGTCYPATLFTTAEGDTRVDPLHARKMAALVQAHVGAARTTADAAVPGGSRRPRRRQAGHQARRRAGRWPDVPRVAARGWTSAVVTVRAEWLVVGGSPEPWRRLGLTVVDGAIPLFGTGIRFDPDVEPGFVGWALSGVPTPARRMGGSPTSTGCGPSTSPASPVLVEHANGAIGLDHVVVTTNELERTCARDRVGHRVAAAAGP